MCKVFNFLSLGVYGCTGVTDVSALGGVKKLTLGNCTGVIDVSALGAVTRLDLTGYTGVIVRSLCSP